MPTGVVFVGFGGVPYCRVGVWVPTRVNAIMQAAMPRAPTMNKNFRPNRSTVQTAFKVKRMPKVALRALISAIWDGSVNTPL